MIRSMTGFGEAAEQIDGIHYAVELRSLNNKYFKATVRLPEEIAGLEAELESALRKRISRGSVTLTVKVRVPGHMAVHRINEAALIAYLDHLETVRARVGETQHDMTMELTGMLGLPGVLGPAEDENAAVQRARPALLKLTQQACDRLEAMRLADGQAVAEDLVRQSASIVERLVEVKQRAPLVAEEYHERLRNRMNDLLARAELKVDEQDLIREVAVFADRCDISEELTRLTAHLDQMQQIIDANQKEPAGRTLDFLAQELLREGNTIASKSNDAQISRAIVEVKGAIARIKEQVQNVE